MSREDFVAVAVRLFAVFLVLLAVRTTGSIIQTVSVDSSWGTAPFILSFTTLPTLVVAALLWYFPLSVSRKLLPVTREPLPALSSEARTLEEVGITLIGIWLVAVALSDLFYWIIFFVAVGQISQPAFELSADQKTSAIVTALELGIGLWLVLGVKGVVGAIRRLRSAGS